MIDVSRVALQVEVGGGRGVLRLSYLMTGRLGDAAEAGTTHLSQRCPIAQRFIYWVNSAVLGFCTQTEEGGSERHVYKL